MHKLPKYTMLPTNIEENLIKLELNPHLCSKKFI